MPRIRRRSRRTTTDYTQEHIDVLLDGGDMFGVFGGRFNRKHGGNRQDDADEATAAMGQAWSELRDWLLPEYVETHPGERPWAWWAFDAEEPRQQLLSNEDAGWRPFGDRLWFGIPRGFTVIPGHDLPYGLFPPIEQMYEGQCDYLARLGLLTEEELQHLA